MENIRQYPGGSSVGKTRKLVGMAILAAIVVVLQLLAYAISNFTPLPVSITLVLIPVVVGSAIYGVQAGAFLGGVFGLIVLVGCITGMDKGGQFLLGSRPIITILLCLVKGIAAGYFAGLVYKAVAKKEKRIYTGVFLAAIICPVINTGIFLAAMAIFFQDALNAWAGGQPIVYFMLIGLAGVNFLIELGLNIVLGPIAVRIIKAGKAA